MSFNIKSRHLIPTATVWKLPDLLWTLFLIGVGTSAFWFIASRVLMLENHVLTNTPPQVDRLVSFNELVRECQDVQYQRYGKTDPLSCKTWANTKIRIYDNL